jgi:hypothetical protein
MARGAGEATRGGCRREGCVSASNVRIKSLAARVLALLPDRLHFYRMRPRSAANACRLTALLSACALFAGSADAGAQSRTPVDSAPRRENALVGTVVDVIGKPMEKVEVYIAGTDRTVRTDSLGVWRFANPPVGPRVVVARQLGFVPYVREVQIGAVALDSIVLVLRRYPRTLSTVEVTARTKLATSAANEISERLLQMQVGSGRLFTRDQILQMRPFSIAELLFGIPGIAVSRGQGEIIVTSTRAGVGILNVEGRQCQLQFYLNTTPIGNEAVSQLDPMTFRSVEVYPQTVQLTGLPTRNDRCGAIVINMMRR